MSRFKIIQANEDGWSDWETPMMRGYRMACCDCGLVHDMDFEVLKITKHNDDGSYKAKELDINNYRVKMRAKRNNRSTGQLRRHSK